MTHITKSTRYRSVISEINFNEIVSESLKNFRNVDFAHRLEVKTTIEGLLPFFSDLKQLQIITNNIISNAIRYQHQHEVNPVLNIHLEVDGKKAIITFQDNGIGIPEEALPRIFNMFYRLPGTQADGAGLGLFLVKEILKKLKGKIGVESKVGFGTKFTIELPNKIDPDLLRNLNKLIENSK